VMEKFRWDVVTERMPRRLQKKFSSGKPLIRKVILCEQALPDITKYREL